MPYVELRAEQLAALSADGVRARYRWVGSSERAYWWALRDEWWRGRSFICLEDDKIPAPGALSKLWGCGHDWCVYPVPMRNGARPPYPALAAAKFSADLISRAPGAIEEAGRINLGFGEGHWRRLDLAIAAQLEAVASPHWHEPGMVEHLHRERR